MSELLSNNRVKTHKKGTQDSSSTRPKGYQSYQHQSLAWPCELASAIFEPPCRFPVPLPKLALVFSCIDFAQSVVPRVVVRGLYKQVLPHL